MRREEIVPGTIVRAKAGQTRLVVVSVHGDEALLENPDKAWIRHGISIGWLVEHWEVER